MFDEPSSYLDVKQRLKAAEAIRNLLSADTYVAIIVTLHRDPHFLMYTVLSPGCIGHCTVEQEVTVLSGK